jgi:signal peptidase I
MSNRYSGKLMKVVIFLIIVTILSKNVFWDYYKISSGSMLPEIAPGDYIFANVLTYRFGLDSSKKNAKIRDRITTLWNIRKGDVIIFNKPDWHYCANDLEFYGPEYVKRCFGEPGDTVLIDKPAQNSGYKSQVPGKYSLTIFPHDTSFQWTLNKMGPIWVPRKGGSVRLDSNSIKLYRTVLHYEGVPLSKTSLDTIYGTNYYFKNDYYFFLGDNFYESEDSRYWGFVPRANLLGKVLVKI